MDSTRPNELTLTDLNAPASEGCSCGDCGCGDGASVSADESAVASATVREDYLVTGMTCGHCVSSVTEELSALAGVDSVTVALEAGGTSVVTVESSVALETDAVRAAVEEAGYGLVGSPR